jgi:ppGpp synthetase/RelA/SpoT-type nucleotidyltranferase
MQDLAGMRIVSDCNRHEQDRIVGKLMQLFAEFGPPLPKLVDRRTHPSHGYRAVHVIVYADGVPVEIQVRTKLQHEWADLFEKLADRVGRGIRYGEPPEHWRDGVVDLASDTPDMNPNKSYVLERLYTVSYEHREATVLYAHALADVIDEYERCAPTAAPDDLADLTAGITAGFASIRSSINEFAPRARPTSL